MKCLNSSYKSVRKWAKNTINERSKCSAVIELVLIKYAMNFTTQIEKWLQNARAGKSRMRIARCQCINCIAQRTFEIFNLANYIDNNNNGKHNQRKPNCIYFIAVGCAVSKHLLVRQNEVFAPKNGMRTGIGPRCENRLAVWAWKRAFLMKTKTKHAWGMRLKCKFSRANSWTASESECIVCARDDCQTHIRHTLGADPCVRIGLVALSVGRMQCAAAGRSVGPSQVSNFQVRRDCKIDSGFRQITHYERTWTFTFRFVFIFRLSHSFRHLFRAIYVFI